MSLSRLSLDKEDENKDLVEVLSEELQCDICLKTFVDPKTLACLHSFCKICVDRLMKVAANTHDLTKLHRRHFFSCPVCRKRHAIPCNGVEGLQTHFKLANLCAILRKSQSQSSSPTHYCSVHTEKRLELFCTTCLSCICHDCKDSHKKHKIEDIELAAKTQRNNVTDNIMHCSTLVGRVDKHVNSIDAYLNKEADLIAAVKTARNDLINSINNQEREQLQQIRTLFTNRSGKRLAEYRVEMIRLRKSLQEACSEADMVNSLDEMEFLLNVKKTMKALTGDGFDSENLPSFYSHDICFDKPCLPENSMGMLSYKEVNRGPSSTSHYNNSRQPSSTSISVQQDTSGTNGGATDTIEPSLSGAASGPSVYQSADVSSTANSSPPSALQPRSNQNTTLPPSPIGAQTSPLLPPNIRANKWFQKVIHDHRSSEYQSAMRGLTHDGRIVSYEWSTDELHGNAFAIQALYVKSPSHEGFVRCRGALSRFPDIADIDMRISTGNSSPSSNSLWLCDRVRELSLIWDTVSTRRTAIRSIDPTRYFRCVINDFRASVGGTWLRGVTYDGAIVSFKYEGPGDGCVSIDREGDPFYLDLLHATWRMPDRMHLPLFREQLYVLYKIWEINLRMRVLPSQ